MMTPRDYLLALHADLCHQLSAEDGEGSFLHDRWQRPEGGGEGCTSILSEGALIERAGVNVSHIRGTSLPSAGSDRLKALSGAPFEAMGLSTVIHPRSPFVPTAHANVRFLRFSHPIKKLCGGLGVVSISPPIILSRKIASIGIK